MNRRCLAIFKDQPTQDQAIDTVALTGFRQQFGFCRYEQRVGKNKRPLKVASAAFVILAPQVGLEPTTLRLTAECSAIELLRNKRPT